ncbi:hypothetical protein LZ575_08295 [Antarcticibacterium sp. 1MA-6-2]|uniref:hypothetical protein n=1 Tax=Antarcticibacterium sp. 1MA-6-2 TaxID=2908210 RepID=UPI001F369171|nr:hypothetical protein [Antarcticibacterium sp. 1MA-6-2]UJH92479.1 hypothetical protein LZ575_08295 [Antarcticibacterium sp. 1MA-6-2]
MERGKWKEERGKRREEREERREKREIGEKILVESGKWKENFSEVVFRSQYSILTSQY